MGIGSGIILFVVCLSGTVYTFSTEINEGLNRSLFYASPHTGTAQRLPVETIVANAEHYLGGGKATAVSIPANSEKCITVTVQKQAAVKAGGGGAPSAKPAGGRGENLLVDPYTGVVKGNAKTGSSEFFGMVMRLHRWLLLDTSTGRPIVGIATIIFCLLVITGFVIWIPRKARRWRQG